MPTGSMLILSGSTNGRGILVVATATLGTTIHTAVAGTADHDSIWIWAVNSTATSRVLSIEFGGVTSPGDLIEDSIPSDDNSILMVPGWILRNALVVSAFCAAAASAVSCFGYVLRYDAA